MPRLLPSTSRRLVGGGWTSLAGGAAIVIALALSGCTAGAAPEPSASVSATSAGTIEPTAEPSAPPAAPTLDPGATAEDNLAFFAAVVASVWATEDRAAGRAYIDALTAAGFDKSAMQVTEDRSTVGDAAESIQFAVRWSDGQCLTGQVGPATGEPVTAVLPAVGDGACLLGATRPIDW